MHKKRLSYCFEKKYGDNRCSMLVAMTLASCKNSKPAAEAFVTTKIRL